MMEARLKYILFPLVLGIWGYAAYRYFLEPPAAEQSSIQSGAETGPALTEIRLRDTFSLLNEYRDPFLGRPYYEKKTTVSNSASVSAPVKIPPSPKPPEPEVAEPVVQWQQLTYMGLVRENRKKGEVVGLIRYNGRTHTIGPGTETAGLRIEWLTADSVRVEWQSETKTLGR